MIFRAPSEKNGLSNACHFVPFEVMDADVGTPTRRICGGCTERITVSPHAMYPRKVKLIALRSEVRNELNSIRPIKHKVHEVVDHRLMASKLGQAGDCLLLVTYKEHFLVRCQSNAITG